MYNIFFQPVNEVISMKETAEKALKRLGIKLVRDLIFYKPTSYNIIKLASDLRKLKDSELIQAEVIINEIAQPRSKRGPIRMQVSNNTGELILVFFNKIPPFIYSKLKVGQKYIIAGKVQLFDGFWQITHPEFIFNKELSTTIQPVYPLTYGIINKQLYSYILAAIKAIETSIVARYSFSPVALEEKEYMRNLLMDIRKLHLINLAPDHLSIESTIKDIIKRFAENELLANQIALAKLKSKEQKVLGQKFQIASDLKQQVLDRLGFELTDSQQNAIKEIESDQASIHQMMKLLQGDVGSGKTLVAIMTMINVAKTGMQSALMVPTDLLSVQHFQFFKSALEGTNIIPALLTGKTSTKERREIKEALLSGKINMLIGTHALFQEAVEFRNLGYVIIDEQHRFGVEQRLELINKALHPDVLVMTATPIPRSLTLTMFGDMSVSQIKTKPKNRLPIITTIIANNKKDEIIDSLSKKLQLGEKIYWVCPLIDQKDKSLDIAEEAQDGFSYSDVTSCYELLEKSYPGKVAILHGKMKSSEKDEIMQKFKDGMVSILVATTVIEVGIDVPDATLIIIENAEKFGLAQLHQLRGRVGRGVLQSYCVLMYNPKRFSKMARQRLEIMRSSSDGFYIAEQDLILRGGGEILGTKQSGEPDFFFADLGRDLQILLKVNKIAKETTTSELIDFQIKLFAMSNSRLVG